MTVWYTYGYIKNGVCSMAKKITFEDVKFNYELAYNVYVQVKQNWSGLSKTQRSRARRQIESMLTEAGFRGNKTGLVSKAALETIINKKKGIKSPNNPGIKKEKTKIGTIIIRPIVSIFGIFIFINYS